MQPKADTTPPTVWILLLAVGAGYLLHCREFWLYINDDAFISFRYSKHLALGHGLVYNVGQYVEGYTNFLYTVFFAGILRVWPDLTLMVLPKYLGVAAGLVVVATAYSTARRLLDASGVSAETSAHAALLAPALLAGNVAFALNSVSGLETTCFVALVLLGARGDVIEVVGGRNKNRFGWLWYGLAALTRPEGAVLFALSVGIRLVVAPATRRPRALLRHVGPVVAIVAAHLAFRIAYYEGELLPNTYWAKQGGDARKSGMGYVWDYLRDHELWAACLLGIPGIWWLANGARRAAVVLLVVAAGFLATFAVTGADWMKGARLIMPVAPHLAILVTVGLTAAVVRWGRDKSARIAGGALAAICVTLLIVDNIQEHGRRQWHRAVAEIRAKGYRNGHLALSDWMRNSGTVREGDTVALMDIGLIGFRNMDCRILDITGLTDRTIGKSPGRFLNKEYEADYVFSGRPRLIVVVVGGFAVRDPDTGREIPQWSPYTANDGRVMKALQQHPEYVPARKPFRHDCPGPAYLLVPFVRRDDRTKSGISAPPAGPTGL